MQRLAFILGRTTSAIVLCLGLALSPAAVIGDDGELDRLFELLQYADPGQAAELEGQIVEYWSESGSPTMNILLRRGRQSMAAGEFERAVEHLSLLTEQAPEFAEGWNARATAYFFMGAFTLSVADIQRTLALNPRHFGAMTGFAMILEESGDIGNALRAYRAVEDLHPNRPGLKESIQRLERRLFDSAF